MSRAQELLQLIASFEDELKSMQEARDQISDLMRPFEDKRRAYRQELLDLMVEEGIGRAHGSGFSAVVSKRTTYLVTNYQDLKNDLLAHGRLEECLTLDERRVFDLAKRHPVAGVETVEKPELRLTPKKEN